MLFKLIKLEQKSRINTKDKHAVIFDGLYRTMRLKEKRELQEITFFTNQPWLLGIRFNYLKNVFNNKELIKIRLTKTGAGFFLDWLNIDNEIKARDELVFKNNVWQAVKHKTNDQKQAEMLDTYYKKMKIGQQLMVPELKFKTNRPEFLGVRRNFLKDLFVSGDEITIKLERMNKGFILKWCNREGEEQASDEIYFKKNQWCLKLNESSQKLDEQELLFKRKLERMKIGNEERIENLTFYTNRPRILNVSMDFLENYFLPEETLHIKLERIRGGFIVKWCSVDWDERFSHLLLQHKEHWFVKRPKTTVGFTSRL